MYPRDVYRWLAVALCQLLVSLWLLVSLQTWQPLDGTRGAMGVAAMILVVNALYCYRQASRAASRRRDL